MLKTKNPNDFHRLGSEYFLAFVTFPSMLYPFFDVGDLFLAVVDPQEV